MEKVLTDNSTLLKSLNLILLIIIWLVVSSRSSSSLFDWPPWSLRAIAHEMHSIA